MGSPLPPSVNQIPQYYAHPHHPPPPGQPMGITSSPHNSSMPMRFQLPPNHQEPRMMSGGRHKKEIKRRTKTGCLTCRKRRIKCDEGHPICRNCQKSKRECLGYDPIFKQQPGPAQIQPAPSAAPHQNSIPASAPPTSLPYQVPQGYAPAVSAGYVSGITPAATFPNAPHVTSAIDPQLASTDSAMHPQPPYNGAQAANPALRGIGSASPFSSTTSDAVGAPIKAKPVQVKDLFHIGGHEPPTIPPRPTPIDSAMEEEIGDIFSKDYAAGLDAILETKWFSTNGLGLILETQALYEEFAFFVNTVNLHTSSMYDRMVTIFGQEARLIWHMLALCKRDIPRSSGDAPNPVPTNGTTPANAEADDLALMEVRARFDILEALLTNHVLETNPVRQLPYPAEIVQARKGELEFWEQLGNFVVYEDNDAAPPGEVEHALGVMRQVLQQIEVRDVLYSIAIARRFGARFPGFPKSVPQHVIDNRTPEDDLSKLEIAMRFLVHESRVSQQQVVARIADMAQLSWKVSRNMS